MVQIFSFPTPADYSRFQERDDAEREREHSVMAGYRFATKSYPHTFSVRMEVTGENEWTPFYAEIRENVQGTQPLVLSWKRTEGPMPQAIKAWIDECRESIDEEAATAWHNRAYLED